MFWRVAGVLVVAQVATALLAVVLSGVFAQERSQELLEGTLRLRLDAVAEEVEDRADIGPLGEIEIPNRLGADLATRFPDPLALLDETGAVVDTFYHWFEAFFEILTCIFDAEEDVLFAYLEKVSASASSAAS
ncbi:MAG: hypothetical protein AAF845_19870, partial [Bacteroidota bacterium]